MPGFPIGAQIAAELCMMIVAAACTLFAFVQWLLALRVRARVPVFRDVEVRPLARHPRLSVIVPARNEEAGIEAALRSKLSATYPSIEIVVVDDRSTDRTGEIARNVADARVVVTRIDELPSGWLGKVHAMSVGIRHATGDFILLSDADVHIAPGVLERAIAYAEENRVDLVSIMPRLDANGFLIDACTTSMMRILALAGRTWEANDDRSTIGVGVGAFNLVRRSALQKSPGLEWLRMEFADDVALGAMLKASGARCRFFAGQDDVTVLYAKDVAELARGLEKGGGMFGFSIWRSIAAAAGAIAIDLAIPLAALATSSWWLGVAQFGIATLTIALLARHFRMPMRGLLLWPIGALLGALMGLRAGLLAWHRQAIMWRGTFYGASEINRGRRWIRGRVAIQ